MASIDELLLSINSMQHNVEKQVSESEEELKSQTRRLTYHDKLIPDEMLLSLEPDMLKSALTDDEFTEFVAKYPEYANEYNIDLHTNDDIIETVMSSELTQSTSENLDVGLSTSEVENNELVSNSDTSETMHNDETYVDELVQDDMNNTIEINKDEIIDEFRTDKEPWLTPTKITVGILFIIAIITIIALTMTIK